MLRAFDGTQSCRARTIEYTGINEDGDYETMSGTAEYIYMQESATFVYVNGEFVKFEDITSVKDAQ